MKKSFGILLSAALLLTFCVSGNLAVSAAETETVVETEQQDGSQEEQNGYYYIYSFHDNMAFVY